MYVVLNYSNTLVRLDAVKYFCKTRMLKSQTRLCCATTLPRTPNTCHVFYHLPAQAQHSPPAGVPAINPFKTSMEHSRLCDDISVKKELKEDGTEELLLFLPTR
jgi:hypothetical protein